MKFRHLAHTAVILAGFTACGRSPEAAAPSPASASVGVASGAPAPATPEAVADQSAMPAAAPEPSPAPAPQGLDDQATAHKQVLVDEEEFKSLAAAERALNQAKSDLDRLALAESPRSEGRSGAAARSAEKKDKGAEPPSAAQANSGPSALCDNACRAFSSLARAASAVCRLDSSSSNSHCTRARRVVAESQQRVASCACPPAN